MRTVSVVINNYNYARFLRQAIDSALAQSYAAEVVVVDDGSSDDSVQVIQSYGDKIRPVLKTNGGQGSAFNAGFAAARGDIIVLLDSDDYFSPVAVEHLVSAWKEDTAILYHRLRVVDASGREIGVNPPARDSLEAGDQAPALLQHGGFCYPPTSGQVYSRSLLSQILPMPEREWMLCADTYLAITAAFRAKVSVMDETLAYYRMHDANTFGLPLTRAPNWPPTRNSRSLATRSSAVSPPNAVCRRRLSRSRRFVSRNCSSAAPIPPATSKAKA